MYDLIIIGMGVSGVSAAIYAKRAGLNVLMLEASAPGGTLNIIPNIENYPGIKSISGPDLAFNLYNEVNELGIEHKLEEVTDVILEDIKTIKTKKGENMAFVLASDETGVGEFTIFPKAYYMLSNLKIGDIINIQGRVTKRFDSYNINVDFLNKI